MKNKILILSILCIFTTSSFLVAMNSFNRPDGEKIDTQPFSGNPELFFEIASPDNEIIAEIYSGVSKKEDITLDMFKPIYTWFYKREVSSGVYKRKVPFAGGLKNQPRIKVFLPSRETMENIRKKIAEGKKREALNSKEDGNSEEDGKENLKQTFLDPDELEEKAYLASGESKYTSCSRFTRNSFLASENHKSLDFLINDF